MTHRLHCFGESGHSYKAALGLTLAGLDWEPVKIDFFAGQSRDPDWRAATNPMGEAPVLETEDGLRLTQSGVILQWITDTTGTLGGDDPYEVLRWVLWDNHKMSSQAGMLRFLMNFLPEDKRPAEVIAFTQGRLKAALQVLERHLEGREFIAGRDVTAADLSCCSYLYYPEPFGFDRADWPNISRWLGAIAALPGWAHPYDLMPRAYAA